VSDEIVSSFKLRKIHPTTTYQFACSHVDLLADKWWRKRLGWEDAMAKKVVLRKAEDCCLNNGCCSLECLNLREVRPPVRGQQGEGGA